MFSKVTILLLACLGSNAQDLEVSLYYETLCPDCIEFITHQLYPAFKEIGSYLNVTLIPFGNAKASKSSGHWIFTCQHGPKECLANKIHSCTLALFSSHQTMEFIYCSMNRDNSNFIQNFIECANETDVTWSSIKNCLSSGKADELLAENGRKTNSVTPKITYVPTIIFDGIFNEEYQKQAEHHFLKIACYLLKNEPPICHNLDINIHIIRKI